MGLHRLVIHGALTVPIVCVLMVLLAVARLKPKSAICKEGSVSSSYHSCLVDIVAPAMHSVAERQRYNMTLSKPGAGTSAAHLDSEAMGCVRLVRKQDVAGTQVAMEDALAVQVAQALGHLQSCGQDDAHVRLALGPRRLGPEPASVIGVLQQMRQRGF